MIQTRKAQLEEIEGAPYEELAPGLFYNRETGETLISDGEQAVVVTAILESKKVPPEKKEIDEAIAYILKNEPGETLILNDDDD